ncbi:MAG: class I SAM-dependent methyltransferase [Paludibacteraceae bacterium]|nr:class I SAM-dependent methyltransferase [Paludibacteraceae bacterium]
MIKHLWFRVWSMVWHHLSAWNTGGEGIHSPRLFYLVRHVLYDTNRLYAWEAIEQRREAMLRAPKIVHIEDYGTGVNREELVMHIAQKSVMKASDAQRLSRLLNYMSGKEYVPNRQRALRVVELGTCLGLTTAYLASVNSANEVITFEGSAEIGAMAEMNWQKLGLQHICLVKGNIDETLPKYIAQLREQGETIDFVLMDANHTGEATLRYWEWLRSVLNDDSVVVLDDIRYSQDMYAAWKQIGQDDCVTSTMDLGQMGVVLVYPPLIKRHYRLRV